MEQMRFTLMEGEYLGQASLDTVPVIFAPDIISTIWGLHSSLAFSPNGTEVTGRP